MACPHNETDVYQVLPGVTDPSGTISHFCMGCRTVFSGDPRKSRLDALREYVYQLQPVDGEGLRKGLLGVIDLMAQKNLKCS